MLAQSPTSVDVGQVNFTMIYASDMSRTRTRSNRGRPVPNDQCVGVESASASASRAS